MSKAKLWQTLRKPGELEHLKRSQDSLALWKQNIKQWGVAWEFLSNCVINKNRNILCVFVSFERLFKVGSLLIFSSFSVGLDWKYKKKQPISKEKLWKTFRKSEELLFKTTLEDYWLLGGKNIKKWGLNKDFCTVNTTIQLHVMPTYHKAEIQHTFNSSYELVNS